MRKKISGLVFVALIGMSSLPAQSNHPEPHTLEIGSKAINFSLPGVDGKTYSLKDFKAEVLVIIFSCNHCPTAQAYEERIMTIAKEYKPQGVDLVVISPNSPRALNLSEMGYTDLGDSFDDMKARAKYLHFTFPYLYDGDDQKTSIAYGPMATPHCFVFDKDRILQYCGRVDGHEKPGTGKGEDLRNALDAVLAGKTVATPVTKVFGCSIKWSWKDEYTRRLYQEWAELPVTLEPIDSAGIAELVRNRTNKLRLINIWATWCGPCVLEFPELVKIDRMYRGRNFEFISISADIMKKRTEVLEFLKDRQASNKNYIYSGDDVYKLIGAADPEWYGGIPYTIIVEPGGKMVYHKPDAIDPLFIKRLIVGDRYIGRYY